MPLQPKQSNLPLYRGVHHLNQETVVPLENQHFGLVWERFFDGYTENYDKFLDLKKLTDRDSNEVTQQEQHGKADFVSGFGQKPIEPTSDLAQRQRDLIDAMGGKTAPYKIEWRFVTGLGIEHPTENGFTWHRTLGTPYLPGASVKGLVRGYLEWLYEIKPDEPTPDDPNDPDNIAQKLTHWFGSPHKDPRRWPENTDSRAGWFVFFDALPIGSVTLSADVMTPHMGQWYEKGGGIGEVNGEPDPAAVPADWHSPNPVVFLVVKQASLQFGVAIRENLPEAEREKAKAALDKEVMETLKQALEWIGAGAKTAVGYGRMRSVRDRLKERIAEWEESELARRFGIDINSTRKEFVEEFELLFALVRELRHEDIAGWRNATRKTDKLRWKACRNLTGQE